VSSDQGSAKQFWESRYGESDAVWSGRVNSVLADVAGALTPGRALDVGCGEGGDSIWLAKQGWTVTGADISDLALSRADAAASAEGCADRIRWVSADLATWAPDETYDLVSACFFQSPIELPRADVLRRLAGALAPGGRLLVVSHHTVPPWSRIAHMQEHESEHEHAPHLPSAAEEVAGLGLADAADPRVVETPGPWVVEVAEDRPREVTGPDGQRATILDAVVVLRHE
jgi:SAM-dependent methyltransferase